MKYTFNILDKVTPELQDKINLFTSSESYRLIATTIYSDIKEKFVDEKDVNGKRFAPLKPSTIKQKQSENKIPYRILRDTGQLLNSLNYSISGNEIRIGYAVPYAKYHQFGTKKMAQRKILPTKDEEIPHDEIKQIVYEYFKSL